MKRNRPTHCDVKRQLQVGGFDFHRDFFTISPSDVSLVVEAAQATGYRKSKNAPGSRGRMYYGLLQRQRCGG